MPIQDARWTSAATFCDLGVIKIGKVLEWDSYVRDGTGIYRSRSRDAYAYARQYPNASRNKLLHVKNFSENGYASHMAHGNPNCSTDWRDTRSNIAPDSCLTFLL